MAKCKASPTIKVAKRTGRIAIRETLDITPASKRVAIISNTAKSKILMACMPSRGFPRKSGSIVITIEKKNDYNSLIYELLKILITSTYIQKIENLFF